MIIDPVQYLFALLASFAIGGVVGYYCNQPKRDSRGRFVKRNG